VVAVLPGQHHFSLTGSVHAREGDLRVVLEAIDEMNLTTAPTHLVRIVE
jgi:hypothetical protein